MSKWVTAGAVTTTSQSRVKEKYALELWLRGEEEGTAWEIPALHTPDAASAFAFPGRLEQLSPVLVLLFTEGFRKQAGRALVRRNHQLAVDWKRVLQLPIPSLPNSWEQSAHEAGRSLKRAVFCRPCFEKEIETSASFAFREICSEVDWREHAILGLGLVLGGLPRNERSECLWEQGGQIPKSRVGIDPEGQGWCFCKKWGPVSCASVVPGAGGDRTMITASFLWGPVPTCPRCWGHKG